MKQAFISETILKRLPQDPIGYHSVLHVKPSGLAKPEDAAGPTQIAEIPLAMTFGPVHGADLFDFVNTAEAVMKAELEYGKGGWKIEPVCSIRPVSLDHALVFLTHSSLVATQEICQILRKLLSRVDVKTEWHNSSPYYWGTMQRQLAGYKAVRLRFAGHTDKFFPEDQQKVLDLARYIHLRRHPEKTKTLLKELSRGGQFEAPPRR